VWFVSNKLNGKKNNVLFRSFINVADGVCVCKMCWCWSSSFFFKTDLCTRSYVLTNFVGVRGWDCSRSFVSFTQVQSFV